MLNKTITLRNALMTANLDTVCKLINKKDGRNIAACDRPSMKQTVDAYTNVIDELLSKPHTRAYSMLWLVQESIDPFDKKKYADVCFLNPKYVAPTKGLKPWGGKNPPKGHYNCNANKYNRTFASGWTSWSKIIDTPIINEIGYSLNKLVAEILWEITFYGWTEAKVDANISFIEDRCKEAKKEIKAGKYIEISPKKKNGFKVVIPNSISQQIVDIMGKLPKKNKLAEAKKCNTCVGYGLWAIGDASPVGPMDSHDGVPTKPCPECGADGSRK